LVSPSRAENVYIYWKSLTTVFFKHDIPI